MHEFLDQGKISGSIYNVSAFSSLQLLVKLLISVQISSDVKLFM